MKKKTVVYILLGIVVILLMVVLMFQQVGVSHCHTTATKYCYTHGMDFCGFEYNAISGCEAHCWKCTLWSGKQFVTKKIW